MVGDCNQPEVILHFEIASQHAAQGGQRVTRGERSSPEKSEGGLSMRKVSNHTPRRSVKGTMADRRARGRTAILMMSFRGTLPTKLRTENLSTSAVASQKSKMTILNCFSQLCYAKLAHELERSGATSGGDPDFDGAIVCLSPGAGASHGAGR